MSETTIRGSLIPEIFQAVARLYDQRIDPLCTQFIFDSKKRELRVVEDETHQVVVTIPYLHSPMCYSGLTPWERASRNDALHRSISQHHHCPGLLC